MNRGLKSATQAHISRRFNAPYILLEKLPRTALPSDIWRMIQRSQTENIVKAELNYHRFERKGQAFLTLSQPEFCQPALKALANASISALPVQASPCEQLTVRDRVRGARGYAEASERNLFEGDGPSARVTQFYRGKCVVISGFPKRFQPGRVKNFLKGFKFIGSEGGRKEVVKVEPPAGIYAISSKFLVRLASVSEAHRLVRHIHMRFYDPETHEGRFRLRAQVVS
ncbi:hypothetical protein JAAARDRAFT_55494 [Jaapia argillacea MUCL 33604]|uniref:RRM domain-containing protein n=1 Tax=Jaapia argillacea MUCL 33604 TaxID=933084 RepID=A0A067Q3M6_9AGAM|nr:hypothetical protein JAAARDRAFT_55494 [Jaapia argillacea MUCL 33604]